MDRKAIALALVWTLAASGGAEAQLMNNLRVTPDMSNGRTSAGQDYDMGVDALNGGRFREAAQHLDRALNASPKDPTLLTLYGQALEGMKDWTSAERAFAKALRFNSDQLLARREHGIVLARLGRLDQARAELEELQRRQKLCNDDCASAVDLSGAIAAVQAAIASSPPPSG